MASTALIADGGAELYEMLVTGRAADPTPAKNKNGFGTWFVALELNGDTLSDKDAAAGLLRVLGAATIKRDVKVDFRAVLHSDRKLLSLFSYQGDKVSQYAAIDIIFHTTIYTVKGKLASKHTSSVFKNQAKIAFREAFPDVTLPFAGKPSKSAAASEPQWSEDINELLYSVPQTPEEENEVFNCAYTLRKEGEQGGRHLDGLKTDAFIDLFRLVWHQHKDDGDDILDLDSKGDTPYEREQLLCKEGKVVQLVFFNLIRRGYTASQVRAALKKEIADAKANAAYQQNPVFNVIEEEETPDDLEES